MQNVVGSIRKTEHEVIAEFYLNPICEVLRTMNGNTGKVTDYYGYVIYGLLDDIESEDGINPFMKAYGITREDAVEAFATAKNVVPVISSFNFDCPK